MPPYRALFEPLTLNRLTLKNRILSTAHEPAYATGGRPGLDYQLYHEEKAKGGIALTIFGGSANIAVDSQPTFGQLYIGDDAIIEDFRAFSERIHRHECAIMCQITHMGRRTTWNSGPWLLPLAPSAVREQAHRSFPRVIEHHEIDRISKQFSDAAWRCREGGLDGCELLSYGHLIGQFLSPLSNRRRDEYGGSIENRARFGLQALERIRERVGPDFVVGLRLSVDERIKGGYDEAEGIEIASLFAASGLVDYLTINVGQISTYAGSAASVPGMAYPNAPYLATAGRVRLAVSVPIFHACRVADFSTANHAIEAGHVDMIGMVRAHLADPHMVRKVQAGEEHRVRPCVGSGYCIDRIYQGHRGLCIHNPATGREQTLPHILTAAKVPGRKVVVVGAGPAGLEAARVSAERGHRVKLIEAAARLGGQINLAARLPWRQALSGVVDWRRTELERLGVDIILGQLADVHSVLDTEPDVVIIATGGVPNTAIVEGHEYAISTWDLLSGQVRVTGEVLIFDDHGQHQGASSAELVVSNANTVELVTPDRASMQELGNSNFAVHLKNLYAAGVTMTPDHRVLGIVPAGNRLRVSVQNEYTEKITTRLVDHVVVEHGTLAVDSLYYELKAGSHNLGQVDTDALAQGNTIMPKTNPHGTYWLLRVGDALASRNIHAAIHDSLRACKDL